jgi:hypothetical protein
MIHVIHPTESNANGILLEGILYEYANLKSFLKYAPEEIYNFLHVHIEYPGEWRTDFWYAGRGPKLTRDDLTELNLSSDDYRVRAYFSDEPLRGFDRAWVCDRWLSKRRAIASRSRYEHCYGIVRKLETSKKTGVLRSKILDYITAGQIDDTDIDLFISAETTLRNKSGIPSLPISASEYVKQQIRRSRPIDYISTLAWSITYIKEWDCV